MRLPSHQGLGCDRLGIWSIVCGCFDKEALECCLVDIRVVVAVALTSVVFSVAGFTSWVLGVVVLT